MTTPEPIPYYAPTYPPAAGGRAGVMVAWVVIVSIVAFLGYGNWAASRTEALKEAADEVGLRMAARYVVGAHAFLVATQGPKSRENDQKLLRGVLDLARSPRQRLQAATVVGEVSGGGAAVKALNADAGSFKAAAIAGEAESLRTIYTRGAGALPAAQRDELVRREGWFGQLALSYGRPSSEPDRRAVLRAGERAFAADPAFALFVMAALASGITLFIIALVMLARRTLPLAYRPGVRAGGPFLEAFALYLAGFVGISWLMGRRLHASEPVEYGVVLAWVAFACAWPLLRGVRWSELRRGLGWVRGRGVFAEAGAGIVGYFAGMPLIALAVIVTVLLGKYSGAQAIHPIIFQASGGWRAIVGLYLLASVFAPAVEETMFRGALFHHLRARHRWLLSAAASALIFAALHPQGWTAIPVLGAIGFVFAGIREWRGSVLASAAAHSLNNALATTLLVLTVG